jgi:sterol desaturase/sphingolipid hydroxylase (fatty acid hydroxylase superfamily)
MKTTIAIAAWTAAAILASELLGYLLHRLLHSGWIRVLSMNHMKHHLLLYGPLQKQRPSREYLDATTGQIAIGNVGLEWIVPAGILLIAFGGLFRFFGVSLGYQVLFFGIVLAWSFWVFSYLHDRMHIKGFWMERAPIVRLWFCWARNLHDIHHRAVTDHGLLDKNFGIGFAFFDWLFGTMASVQPPFNHAGLEAAKERFDFVMGETGRHGEEPREGRRNTSNFNSDATDEQMTLRPHPTTPT